MIYADNAATTKLNIDAFEAMKPFLLEHYGNASQSYSFARASKKALQQARVSIAECINALPEEIYFTSGGTESDNWAIKGAAFSDVEKKTNITTEIEHHAVLRSYEFIESLGYPVLYLSVARDGKVQTQTLESNITYNTNLVSIMMANNEIGTIQPIRELCKIAHLHGTLFHTDAVQALGHIKVDVRELGIDLLSASGHKFNAPKGVGFLYIRKNTRVSSYINGGAQEFGMRAGTENVASIVAMATALKKNCDNMQANTYKLHRMEDRLLSILSSAGINYIQNGSNHRIPGNLNLSFYQSDGEMILHRLDLMGILVSTGSACDSVSTKVSHVIKSIAVPKDFAEGTIRISFGAENDYNDAEAVANALIRTLCTK
jgi:cysteine desulfurase